MSLYHKLISPECLAALVALHAEKNTTGTVPDDDLDVLAGLIVASKAARILQFGTFLGGSALVLADLARQNDSEHACLATVDTDPAMNETCRHYAEQAGLGAVVETIDGNSLDPQLVARLSGRPWDAIFLDTTHQYMQTLEEIKTITPLCSDKTVFYFHDASAFAADTLDLGHQGGVRQAMREWCLTHPRWQWFICEAPAFGQYGIGLMQKRVAA